VANLEEVITEIATVLESVSGIGRVWNYNKWDIEADAIEAVFGVAETTAPRGWHLHVWFVDRVRTEEPATTQQSNVARHALLIRGLYEIHDRQQSRLTFRALCEAIRDALRLVHDTPAIEWLEPPQVLSDDDPPVMVGSYLCHHIQMSVTAHERLATE
jgi:hypothetical protein